jgi:hypothetical protein
MKYAVEMGLDAKFHKYCFRYSKVDKRGIHRHTDRMVIA